MASIRAPKMHQGKEDARCDPEKRGGRKKRTKSTRVFLAKHFLGGKEWWRRLNWSNHLLISLGWQSSQGVEKSIKREDS